jgi:hypothetical protein
MSSKNLYSAKISDRMCEAREKMIFDKKNELK